MRYAISETIKKTETDNELIILDITSGEFYGLNDIGKIIFNFIEQGKNNEEILFSLSQMFDIACNNIRSDVEEYLNYLADIGIIRPLFES
ncbi:hypothetical protein J40TS1_07690 [Paenibacillus montaniterrae]|uniref:PqqD family protein n=1 Tax=Paenibacillus montaniterrae TaxID=429341 RepID=A0A920CST7_9BACL|nr:PqqD family protein [Paenibacillus montaniterrae]GIP15127.1 hypothetical protein J40TS1_07690 [Paenibacillus montaniterrae]